MDFILKRAAEIQEEIVAHRRYFHENAEVNNELPKTCAYVMEKLKEMGYEPKLIAQNSGVVALVGKKTGKTFMIRADMDALPMGEETDEPFKSKTPHMHSCGHDLHTAMLLGAAKLLKENEDKINGQVKLMFQPAEETLWGAKAMIDDGLMENPKVDAAMMIHVRTAAENLETGTVLFSTPGVAAASSDGFRIDIKGKGGHGARPQACLDPLTTAAHILINLQEILAKEIAPTDEAVVNICHLEGGSATNIIPDVALMQGTIRTYDPAVREFILKRVPEIIEGTAKLFRTEAELTWLMNTPSVVNNPELFAELLGYAKEVFGADKVVNVSEIKPKEARSPGSEDFAYVSQLVPAVGTGLVAGAEKDGYVFGGHHPKVRYDEAALKTGTAMYVSMAMKWLEKNNK